MCGRVFVLADPDLFSGPAGRALSDDIETSPSGEALAPLDHMRCAVQHGLQAVLGAEQCHGKKLAQALRVSVRPPALPPAGRGGVSPAIGCVELSECWACPSTL